MESQILASIRTAFFCPYCWHVIPEDARICAFCLHELGDWTNAKVVKRLITGLHDPNRSRAVFAAQMLGRHKITRARMPLRELCDTATDPYVRQAVMLALAQLDG